jgi:tRNA pseudouridine55 synthase
VFRDGFLGVNKPAGRTSHDVVAHMRRLFKIAKVGHTGTLDPMATGVLVLCLGKFTRLSQFVVSSDKKYRAEVTLGIETETQDREGKVTAQSGAVPMAAGDVVDFLPSFLGTLTQMPPMYSAVRVGGKRLYELARKGQEIERPTRQIEILGLDLVDYTAPRLTLDVWCSKGTYIRTLAADLGRRIGCGGHLSQLQRTAVGQITLADCCDPDELEEAMISSDLSDIQSLDVQRVLELPQVTLSADQIHTFVNGNADDGIDLFRYDLDQALCIYGPGEQFVGIGRRKSDGLRPACVIAQRES